MTTGRWNAALSAAKVSGSSTSGNAGNCVEGILAGGDIAARLPRRDTRLEPADREALEIEVADAAVAPDLLGRRRPRHRPGSLGGGGPLSGERTTEGARLVRGELHARPQSLRPSPIGVFPAHGVSAAGERRT